MRDLRKILPAKEIEEYGGVGICDSSSGCNLFLTTEICTLRRGYDHPACPNKKTRKKRITQRGEDDPDSLNKEVKKLKRIFREFNKIEKDTLLSKRLSVMKDKAFIDKNTGDISFAGKDGVLTSDLSRQDLESYHEVVMTADASEEGSSRRIYYMRGHYLIERMNFEISIFCKGDRIKEAWLRNTRIDFQEYGSYWSEKKQFERIRVHEKWLERVFGNKRTNVFPWGRIVSNYNPVMGMSYIVVEYK